MYTECSLYFVSCSYVASSYCIHDRQSCLYLVRYWASLLNESVRLTYTLRYWKTLIHSKYIPWTCNFVAFTLSQSRGL